uniref:Uncharacterized protein n=1 Tax=Peronospora matthiolae TaxID=2874970 RepID=A0AAV1VD11_9STRA
MGLNLYRSYVQMKVQSHRSRLEDYTQYTRSSGIHCAIQGEESSTFTFASITSDVKVASYRRIFPVF